MTTTAETPPETKSKPKTERRITLVTPLDAEGKNAVVRITETTHLKKGDRVEVTEYFVDKVESDFGQAFHMEKREYAQGEEHAYHVCIDGQLSTCCCKGFSRWKHCRHVQGLSALVAVKKL